MEYDVAIPLLQDLIKTYTECKASEEIIQQTLERLEFLMEQQKKETE